MQGHSQSPGMTVDDALYTLFRHKWLILFFIGVGIVMAMTVAFLRPPAYTSTAKLMIHYIEDHAPAAPNSEQNIRDPVSSSASLLVVEKELVKTIDVATNAAAMLGPSRLLKGKSDDLRAAADRLGGGLDVEVPSGTPLLVLTFRNRDKTLVQDAVGAIIEAYKQKHVSVHGGGEMDEFYQKQRDAMRKRLTDTAETLRKMKTMNNVVSVEETKEAYQTQITKWQEALNEAEVDLETRRAGMRGGATNEAPLGALPPPEVIKEYAETVNSQDSMRRSLKELLEHYTRAYPTVTRAEAMLQRHEEKKKQLEEQYPVLARMDLSSMSGTNSPTGDLVELQRLTSRVESIRKILRDINNAAAHVMEIEPLIADLERQKQLEETNYYHYVQAVDRQKTAQELSGGKPVNISIVEAPTPPALDNKKFMKTVGGAFGFFVALGIGLAFFIDYFWDRTLRRPVDVQRRLKGPVFLTIPDTTGSTPLFHGPDFGAGGESASMAIGAWHPENALDFYTAGLGERVATYFDLNDQQAKKPKLVGVTSTHHGAGVSSLARGLAMALSQAGDGNVLLVDMNREGARAFMNGAAQADISQALRIEDRDGTKVQDHLYAATVNEKPDALARSTQTRLVQMVPELKDSDYNYIVFDMPPVAPTTPTQRFSNHLDLVLLVVESEKTAESAAARANSLLQESRAKIAPVLNRYRPYVPARLAQDV